MKYFRSVFFAMCFCSCAIASSSAIAATYTVNSNGDVYLAPKTPPKTSSKSSSSKVSSVAVKAAKKSSSSRRSQSSSLSTKSSSASTQAKKAGSSSSLDPNLQIVGLLIFEAGHGQWFITRPFPDSPAEAAGLHEGDEIVAVEGKEVRYISRAEEQEVQKGLVAAKKGSSIHLRIARLNAGEKDITIVMTPTSTSSVSSASSNIVTSEMRNQIGIVRIRYWDMQSTAKSFYAELRLLLAKKPKALVLDLRHPDDIAVTKDQILLLNGQILAAFVDKGTKYGTQTQSSGKSQTVVNLYTEIDPLVAPGTLPIVVLTHTGDLYPTERIAGLFALYASAKTLLESDGIPGSSGNNLDVYEHRNDPPGVVDPALEEAMHRAR